MIDPGHLGDVVDVIDEPRERHARQASHLLAHGAPGLLRREAEPAHARKDGLLARVEVPVEEGGPEVHAHRAAVPCHRPQHGVAHVARHVGELPGGGVGGDDGLPGVSDDVPEERIGDVRDVGHHAETLHLVDDPAADVGQSLAVAVVARGAAERARDGPGEGQVAGSARVERAQVLEHLRLAPRQQRVPALHAEEGRDALALGVGPDVGGAPGPGDRLGMRLDHRVDGVELLHRLGVVALGLRLPGTHEDGEELRVEAPGVHLREIDVHVRLGPGEVDPVVGDSLGAVGVRIDDDGAPVQLEGGDGRRGPRGAAGHEQQRAAGEGGEPRQASHRGSRLSRVARAKRP